MGREETATTGSAADPAGTREPERPVRQGQALRVARRRERATTPAVTCLGGSSLPWPSVSRDSARVLVCRCSFLLKNAFSSRKSHVGGVRARRSVSPRNFQSPWVLPLREATAASESNVRDPLYLNLRSEPGSVF